MINQLIFRNSQVGMGDFKTDSMNGLDYYLIPVVALQEQVVNGWLALEEEFGRWVDSWNGIPLPIGHPVNINGDHISAKKPGIINDSAGFFFDAKIEGKKLKGNLWIEKEKLDSDDEVFTQIRAKLDDNNLEVSTGYFSQIEAVGGTEQGKTYKGIQRNMVPDHLALLPFAKGACSIEDGCGAPRTNVKEGNDVKKSLLDKLKDVISKEEIVVPATNDLREQPFVNELSFDQITSLLYDSVAKLENVETFDFWLADVYNSYVLYKVDGKFFRVSYQISADDKVDLGSDKTEVKKVVTYEPLTINQKGGEPMKEKVDLLINCESTKFVEGDREWLMSLNEEQLDKMEVAPASTEEPPKANQADSTPPVTPEVNAEAEPAKAEPAKADDSEVKPLTANDVAKIVSDTVSETVSKVLEANKTNERKTQLVAQLTLVPNNQFSKEVLEALEVNILEKMLQDSGISPDQNFFGFGGPMANVDNNTEDMPAPPSVIKADINKN